MISYLPMVNAWSLLGSIVNGTFEEDYPLMNKSKEGWSEEDEIRELDDYYGFRNVGAGNTAVDKDLDWIEKSGGFEWTPGSPWPPEVEEDDGLEYETDYYEDYMADVDEQRAHHFTTYDDGMSLQVIEEQKMDYEPQRNHNFKYHEDEILKDIHEYVSRTYQGHYTGTKHEFRKVQTIDLMAARDIASDFCQANILKYGSRYGSKNGKNKTDLLKVIHYAMLLLHFDGHYGEPSMPSGNFDQMP